MTFEADRERTRRETLERTRNDQVARDRDRETIMRLGGVLLASAVIVGFVAWFLLGPRYECTRTEVRHVEAEPARPVVENRLNPMTMQHEVHVSIDPGHDAYDYTECVAWRRLEDWEER